MPREFGRNRRVGDLIQRELAVLIQRDFRMEDNPQAAALVTVSKVDLSPDLSYAKIFITSLGPVEERKLLVKSLNDAAGHFRHELAQELKTRIVPRLKFVYDEALERGNRLAYLIDSLQVERDQRSTAADDSSSADKSADDDPAKS